MKNRRTIGFIVAGALVVAAVLVLVSQTQSRFDWYETYEIKSKEPYGTYVTGELLKSYFPNKKFIVVTKPISESLPKGFVRQKVNYVFIGKEMLYDSTEASTLLSFVEAGNNAFLSACDYNWELISTLLPDTCREESEIEYVTSVRDSAPTFNFYGDPISSEKPARYQYVFKNEVYTYPWSCFDSALFCGRENAAMAIGFMGDGYVNYLKIHYGSGDFYLHTTPLVFSNYALTKAEHLDYASRIFSFLPPGDIYWDEFNKIPGNLNFNSRLNISQSPLQYVLKQDSLRWAWYSALLLLLLYVLFFARRRQRVIPVLEPVTNTSLEFVQTIGQLYYQQQNHRALGMHQVKLFHAFIRNRYFIQTNQLTEEIIKKISVKSQVPYEEVNSIFAHCHLIEKDINLSQKDLIDFHNLLENFYKNCK